MKPPSLHEVKLFLVVLIIGAFVGIDRLLFG